MRWQASCRCSGWDERVPMPRILVIDDSALMREVLGRHLEKAGFDVEAWMPDSVFEVSERLAATKPDLVLCDYQMPGVNGLSVAKMALKADPRPKVVVLTAFRDPEIEANLKKFGVARVLHKPLKAAPLIEALQEILQASSA